MVCLFDCQTILQWLEYLYMTSQDIHVCIEVKVKSSKQIKLTISRSERYFSTHNKYYYINRSILQAAVST